MENSVAIKIAPHSEALRSYALVLSAIGIAWKLSNHEGMFHLEVDAKDLDRANSHFTLYDIENKNWPKNQSALPFRHPLKVDALFAFGLFLLMFFCLQAFVFDESLFPKIASGLRVLEFKEWYRVVTSLFVHADFLHFGSNLLMGLSFFYLLLPLMGKGLGALGFLISGSVGNLCNILYYKSSKHLSIGFSTAVFGALGIWGAFLLFEKMKTISDLSSWRRMIVPAGAALAMLGLWGSSPESDYMAHFWGFGVGLLYGSVIELSACYKKISERTQNFLFILSAVVVLISWGAALADPRH